RVPTEAVGQVEVVAAAAHPAVVDATGARAVLLGDRLGRLGGRGVARARGGGEGLAGVGGEVLRAVGHEAEDGVVVVGDADADVGVGPVKHVLVVAGGAVPAAVHRLGRLVAVG